MKTSVVEAIQWWKKRFYPKTCSQTVDFGDAECGEPLPCPRGHTSDDVRRNTFDTIVNRIEELEQENAALLALMELRTLSPPDLGQIALATIILKDLKGDQAKAFQALMRSQQHLADVCRDLRYELAEAKAHQVFMCAAPNLQPQLRAADSLLYAADHLKMNTYRMEQLRGACEQYKASISDRREGIDG
jgi:hypothetical protein